MSDKKTPTYTLAEGCPIASSSTAQTFRSKNTPASSAKSLVLLQDTQLIETLAHFSRERIPERVVHALAVGAWGEFEVTKDISSLTNAKFLNGVGKKSKVLLRVSAVAPQAGGAETQRDVRGWAMKIFTEEGNQDFVFNSIPVFFIRDPIKFPSVNRSHKKNPATNASDNTMFWDYHNNNQEGTHAIMILFSNRGIPASIRTLNSYSGHTYKLVNDDGNFTYVKFHFKTNQGVKNLRQADADKLAGENPDYHTDDLFGSIEKGDFPSWTLYIQTMKPDEAEKYRWDIFDMTKVWPHKDFPLQEVGKLTLNRNAQNYFAEIEQAAFSPSTMVPGIAPTADPMLQARMFAYPDAARYRLGVNYQQLPCNSPVSPVYSPYQRDGASRHDTNYGRDPNYVNASLKTVNFKGDRGANGVSDGGHEEWVAGKVQGYATEVKDDDFEQPRMFWEMLGRTEPDEQRDLVSNICTHLGKAIPRVQKEAIQTFKKVDAGFADQVQKGLKL
ncbi:hypothetical protein V499_09789 [Pseudogymnoascus sp. VKM F-103]|nr:hypothetical protein V499_09789 [Pseudogymnoascus sp. VKM F-103]